jgi:uncharacterized protein YecE (DUF72 family)
MTRMKPARIGCSGWAYKHWRGSLFADGLPQRRWLERYAENFPTVEVNSTFYGLPRSTTLDKWIEQTPGDFLFAVKGSRYVTHRRRLTYPGGIEKFWDALEPLRKADKLGPILWQLPPALKRDDERLEAFLAALPEGRHCFEFRHASWFAGAVRKMLEGAGASLVVAHDARSELPLPAPCGPVAYVRFHYGEKGRGGNYSKAELKSWARRIASWRSRREVYAYFNDDMRGFAPANAAELSASLR